MTERFFKYHGLGNDFVILDRRQSGRDIDAEQAIAMCDRRRGIGADGVLVVLGSREQPRMVVHNADGSVAEMCGNGLRCVVKYLADSDGGRPARLDVETGAGRLGCEVAYDGAGASRIQVAMGPARLVAANLPSGQTNRPFIAEPVPHLDGVKGTAVSLGNPHLVLFDAPLDEAGRIGPMLERWERFPQRTNVELVRPEGSGFRVVVWERGSGLTQACGTGACAVVAAAVEEGRAPAGAWVTVTLPGGPLEIRVAPDLSAVDLRGPASFVYEGVVPSRG